MPFYVQIAQLQYSGSNGSDIKWDEAFNIGTVIEGKVEDIKEVGVVISFEKYDDVFGFITNYQCKFSPSPLLFNITSAVWLIFVYLLLQMFIAI